MVLLIICEETTYHASGKDQQKEEPIVYKVAPKIVMLEFNGGSTGKEIVASTN